MARSDGTSTALTIARIFQILTLIACWAILAVLVNIYNRNGNVAPAGVLCLFIVALLASVWAFCVLITQVRARNKAYWMAVGDILLLPGLIAGVILISDITRQCSSAWDQVFYATDGATKVYPAGVVGIGDPVWRDDHNCNLARAAMGLGIANIILFLISAILAIMVVVQNRREDEELMREKVYATATRRGSGQYYVEERRSSRSRRHRHRRRSPRSREYIIEEKIV